MEVLIMQVFVSLLLVLGAVVLLAYSMKQADHEHADRLALFPIEDDSRPVIEAGGDSEPDTEGIRAVHPGQAR